MKHASGCAVHAFNFPLKHEHLINPRCLVKIKAHKAALIQNTDSTSSPPHSSLCCVAPLSNLSGGVGCERDCHSSRLVKSPRLFCDNASCDVLVSLY